MANEKDKVFSFAPLHQYSIRERMLIKAADIAFYALIRLIGATIRFQAEGGEYLDRLAEANKLPILAFWHDRIFAGTYYFRGSGIGVITSQSKDGEYIARFIQRLGYGAIRGSSTRGGVGALVEMIRLMKAGMPMALTVDGPKGPRHVVKPGAAMLAKKTGEPIVPFTIHSTAYWSVNSWDRMQIPKPFSKARVIFAPPIFVKADSDDVAMAAITAELQKSLDELEAVGEKCSKRSS